MSSTYEIITLDGPSGAGKSTIAKLLAKKLSFKYLDTGAMYRAVTLYMIKHNIDINNNSEVISALNNLNINFDNDGRIYLDNEDVTEAIRSMEVVNLVSKVSSISIVRQNMVSLQRKIAEGGNYVVDGRDIGSVVFPNSKYKFYMDASLDERAKRRYNEELSKGKNITYEEVRESIRKRDEFDSNREDSPLVVPENANIIDTTSMTIDEVVEKIANVIFNIKSN
ncbi:(d)CMP kinase [Brachyspira hyodysenteriae]|uniref:Cytidylate kinase n=2 Tax=Brachyspira hyodysenteriae TaxID=159 RepID=A0A3B6VCU3_BRAHW|nr:(d)CMP kinase [Brachyspira hyodysenteriae]ACN83311.1 cytidylate kinase [Brachyspira hyodysenteriae WA1]ANN64539.1 cytidylate kinase [Brachyspira hyodysenteriae ATCC 27164]AUJ49052.1 cytidylate kinase [Brachyspira hyodysenteriae]KLI15476.1 cytidylate kinase [Brachyspira hyodysenteriae]KLI15586.1 cytidylate kinase [Brachyspira hyodysenteriae]